MTTNPLHYCGGDPAAYYGRDYFPGQEPPNRREPWGVDDLAAAIDAAEAEGGEQQRRLAAEGKNGE